MVTPRSSLTRPLLALLACAGLVTAMPLGVGLLQVQRLAALVEVGEVSRWRDVVNDTLRASPPPPTPELLARIVRTHQGAGLRYVALFRRDGGLIAEAGDTVAPRVPCGDATAGRLWRGADRVRACAGLLPPREDGVAPEPPPGAPWMPGGPPRRPPTLVLEFDAQATRDLAHAQVSLVAAWLVAMLAMAGLGAYAARLLRDREVIARRLERARHLSLLGEMSAVLAHEIRNPLASLKGHAQLLAERVASDAKLSSRVERVVHDATRLERLVDELLTFARTGDLDLREMAPAAWAREVAASFERQDVQAEEDGAPARWSFDPSRLGEAVTNLLRNGLEAGGPVTLRVAGEDGALVFEVRDHGPGIPPGEEEAIFEPFHSRKVKGTGLGLAIVRRTVALHGGTVSAHNHPQGGAVFRVVLHGE